MTCTFCGVETGHRPAKGRKNVFCNQSCAAKHLHASGQYRGKPPARCRKCSAELPKGSTSKMTCSACRRPTLSTTLRTLGDVRSALGVKNRHRSWLHAEVRAHNRSYNARLRTRCQVCGYDKHVELAHRRAINTFPDDTLLTEVNAPENNFVLCRNHHWEFDNDLLSPSDIPPR